MVNREFVALCSRAWALQVLVYVYEQRDARISPMAHHLETGRTSVSAAVQHLIELGYLARNTGHGHPLRPAYVLTAKGSEVARWATQLDEILVQEDWRIARKTWVLPVMRQTIPYRRFGELRAQLNPVTDRALSETLKTLTGHNWLKREVDSASSPPRVTYSPCGKGGVLVPCLEASLHVG